jgi:hypothetical protein
MVPHSIALQQCFQEVADSASVALDRCLHRVVAELQKAESASIRSSERKDLGDAWRELLAHRTAWCERYPEELQAAFRRSPAASSALEVECDSVAAPDAGRVELALVDDEEITREIDSSRLVRHVMPLVERPVSELDALVSSAMGLPSVRPELNPVRPEVFAQSLRALIGRSQLKPATGSLWMKYMAEPLGEELQTLYERLVTRLRDADVRPADYRITSPAGPVPPRESRLQDASGPPGATGAMSVGEQPVSYPILSSREISRALLRDFMRHGAGDAESQPLPPSYYAEVEDELTALRQQAQGPGNAAPAWAADPAYRNLPVVDRPARRVDVQSTLDAQVWGDYAHSHQRSLVRSQLRREATQVAQVLGLELVRKVVGQVAQDPRLLGPVREAIVALEPALLRLAMVDPRFFTDEQHPARRLMERVACRSFGFNDEFSTDFGAFLEQVSGSLNHLNHATIASAQPFEEALAQLEAAWQEADHVQEEQRTQVLAGMRFVEVRQAEADQIAWELGSRADLENVPPVVQDFLFGRWTVVLAHARLTDPSGQIDPHGYLAVISDLLWSVKRDVTLKQPAQLFERVPRLVATLRSGLASTGDEPERNEAFFRALMKLHHPVLKLRRVKSRRDARESGTTPLSAADGVPADPAAAPLMQATEGQPWMSARELDAAGFQDTLPTDLGELAAESGPVEPPPQSRADHTEPPEATHDAHDLTDSEVERLLLALREGDWFDLYSHQRWLRAQLIWASSKATLFMFVSRGGQPHSMTRRVCERLLRKRLLRPVRMHGVVEGALDRVEQETGA